MSASDVTVSACADRGQRRGRRKRDVAILGAFAAMDVNDHSIAVDVADLEVGSLLDSQSARVDGGEDGAISQKTDAGEDLRDFFAAEHDGDGLLVPDANALEGRQVLRTGLVVDESNAGEGNGHGSTGELLGILEVEEIVTDLLIGKCVGRSSIVLGELPDGADVALLGAFRESSKLQILGHALAKRRDLRHRRLGRCLVLRPFGLLRLRLASLLLIRQLVGLSGSCHLVAVRGPSLTSPIGCSPAFHCSSSFCLPCPIAGTA